MIFDINSIFLNFFLIPPTTTSSSTTSSPAPISYLPPIARSITRETSQKTMEPLTSKPVSKSWTYITSMANRLVPKRWNFGVATSQYWRDNLPHNKKEKLIIQPKVQAIQNSLKRQGKIVTNSVLRRKCSQLLSCYATSKTCRVAFLSTNCSNIM